MITSNEPENGHYKAGVFYFNREDSRIIVPKRLGLGYTLNFAKPATWVIIGAIVGFITFRLYSRG